jgi:hypothetical protein
MSIFAGSAVDQRAWARKAQMLAQILRVLMITFGTAAVLFAPPRAASEDTEPDRAALAATMVDAKATLEDGLQASEQQGKPISAKFEIDDGYLQLSIYTIQDGGFREVIVDPATGTIARAEAITDPDDLTAAKAQKDAVANASVSLLLATQRAVDANTGFRAVRVLPQLQAGHPVARVTLFRPDVFKTVWENWIDDRFRNSTRLWDRPELHRTCDH